MQTVETIAAPAQQNPFKVGDVLCSSWGYDQTNASFYKVIRVTPKQVTLQEYATVRTEGQGEFMAGTTVPDFSKPVNAPIRRAYSFRTWDNSGKAIVRMTSYEYASLWDGKPQRTSWYA
jgi:hypothetical protein